MGRALATVVPNKYGIDNYGLVANAHSYCNCLKGNCSIKEKIIFGSGVKWCEGNWTGTCTLTTNGAKSFEIASFPF